MAVAHITGVFRFIWRFIKKRVLPACIEARIEQRSIKRNLHVMQNTAKNYDSSLPKGGKPPASLKKFSGS